MPDRLTAWLYGTPVANLSPAENYRVTVDWEHAGIDRWGYGSRVLSISLPLGSPFGPRDGRGLDFFANLLPDGPVLLSMAQVAAVSPIDTFGLLSAFGSDCAGALVLIPEGMLPPDRSAWGSVELSMAEIANAIDNLATNPFGADIEQGWSPSLSGYQGKLLLGRLPDGTWFRPTHGAPSSWILKPDREHRMAENEATCLDLAATCGLLVPTVELLTINGAKVLAIRRYDRDEMAGLTFRIHQEDGCQATGTPPMQKYEYAGGPSLSDIAGLLQAHGEVNATVELLRRVAFNVAIGNADAHAKNFSFLHDASDPTVRLAPAYDLISTVALDPRHNAAGEMVGASTRMGQYVNGVAEITKVAKPDLVSEAMKWGLRRTAVEEVVGKMLDAVRDSVDESDGDGVTLAAVATQLDRIG
jgi:serine/threonine-protein kinase HipA